MAVTLSYVQTRPLLEAHKRGQTVVETSLDLGKSMASAVLNTEGVRFASGEQLDWAAIDKISRSESNCYTISGQVLRPIQIFSHETNRLCSLFPTHAAPSVLIAGFVMHRVKELDPWHHAERMIATLAPINGTVLDTTTGMGYTAILAARTAERVMTIELDPSVQIIAQQNPWSQELFTNPKITQVMGDAYEVVSSIASESFHRVMHDPPAFKLAGLLYSSAFYRECYRLLKRGGRLFHYTGNPTGKASGSLTRGVIRRLQEVGFARVMWRREAYGVVACK